jgi:hypothetical protein
VVPGGADPSGLAADARGVLLTWPERGPAGLNHPPIPHRGLCPPDRSCPRVTPVLQPKDEARRSVGLDVSRPPRALGAPDEHKPRKQRRERRARNLHSEQTISTGVTGRVLVSGGRPGSGSRPSPRISTGRPVSEGGFMRGQMVPIRTPIGERPSGSAIDATLVPTARGSWQVPELRREHSPRQRSRDATVCSGRSLVIGVRRPRVPRYEPVPVPWSDPVGPAPTGFEDDGTQSSRVHLFSDPGRAHPNPRASFLRGQPTSATVARSVAHAAIIPIWNNQAPVNAAVPGAHSPVRPSGKGTALRASVACPRLGSAPHPVSAGLVAR